MLYVVQIFVFLAVIWSSHYHGWDEAAGHNGYAISVVALLAVAVVTGVIDEIQQLPSRFVRMKNRLFGLKDEPGDEIPSLLTPLRHPRNAIKDGRGLRIGKDPGEFVEVTPELPLTVLITDEGPPLTRTEPRFDSLPDHPSTGHRPKLLRIEGGK